MISGVHLHLLVDRAPVFGSLFARDGGRCDDDRATAPEAGTPRLGGDRAARATLRRTR